MNKLELTTIKYFSVDVFADGKMIGCIDNFGDNQLVEMIFNASLNIGITVYSVSFFRAPLS